MTDYEVVEMIMNSNIPDQNYKLHLIQSFLLHYMTQDEVKNAIETY